MQQKHFNLPDTPTIISCTEKTSNSGQYRYSIHDVVMPTDYQNESNSSGKSVLYFIDTSSENSKMDVNHTKLLYGLCV